MFINQERMRFRKEKSRKKLDIDVCFRVIDQLPFPSANLNTSHSPWGKIVDQLVVITQKLQLIQELIK